MNNKKQVVHCKRNKYDIYIGRPSKWGNPFTHKKGTMAEFLVSSRKEAIEAYRDWILGKRKINNCEPPTIQEIKEELRGKILACWCKPLSCHGDILVEIANKDD